jgi:hypothetical protein
MSWFRVSGGRLQYRGGITRKPFTRWMATKEGAASVARVAAGIRFSLLGRSRAARRGIWRTLEDASRSAALAAAIAGEADRYMQAFARLAYADGLPRVHIALHRLVLVPRAMIAARARTALLKRLGEAPALAGLDEATRIFFLEQLVTEMDAAVHAASPSPRQPIQAQDEWACVGVSKGLVWVDPLWAGEDPTGHVFMYEFPRSGMSRSHSRQLEAAILELGAGVASLSRLQRFAVVRTAAARG